MHHSTVISRRVRLTLAALALAGVLAATSPTLALNPPQTTASGVVNVLNQTFHNMWVATFRDLGRTYTAPHSIVYYNVNADSSSWWAQHPTSCDWDAKDGYTQWSHAAMQSYTASTWTTGNSFYCPTDQRIYLDYNWNQYLTSAMGDNASGGILAHEYGHHIQRLLGWDSWLKARSEYAAYELQADCYAGLAMRYAAAAGVLAAGDVAEAQTVLSALGDNRFGSDPYAHGTPEQRSYWFMEGYNAYSLNRCNSVYLWA